MEEYLLQFQAIQHLSLPTPAVKDATGRYWEHTFSSTTWIVLFALISLVEVILHWAQKEYPRYRAYLLCGAKGRTVMFLLLTNVWLLISFAYLAAVCVHLLLTQLMPATLLPPLPPMTFLGVYLFFDLFSLMIVYLRSRRLIHRLQLINH